MQPLYVTAYGNGRGLFGQPFMETEGDYLGNHLWKRKGTIWATIYGNGRGLLRQPHELGITSCRITQNFRHSVLTLLTINL